LSEIDVQGADHLQRVLAEGLGALILPNHPTHADPFVLTEVSDRLDLPFYYMTAWQVFARTHALGRRVLRHHGCFSINREGHDLRAYRQAVQILQGERPLVIFPEGEVFHLNDRVVPFRRGAATAALRAAHRSGRPVACIPCGLKYRYVDDPSPQLHEVMGRLEGRLGLAPHSGMPLGRRILRLADGLLDAKEWEYFGALRGGPTHARAQSLMTNLLEHHERRYRVARPCLTIPERVKEIRRLAIARRDAKSFDAESVQCDLDDLLFVTQLYSYPTDYLTGRPSLERIAETVDKLEEDVLQVVTAGRRGIRRVSVVFGEPVLAMPDGGTSAAELTDELRRRVQSILDAGNSASAPSPLASSSTSPASVVEFVPSAA